MSYTYLSTEGDTDDTNQQPAETSLEAVSLSADESSLPTRHSHRSTAWIVVAVSAVTFLVGLSLFAFSASITSTNEATSEERTEPLERNVN